MGHPTNRGERRFTRATRINHRLRNIAWAHCQACAPAPCHCKDQCVRRGRLAKTPTPCSCFMCGNPRRYHGDRTLSEKRASLAGLDEE